MGALQATPSSWSRQDVLALLQLLTMILISTIGAFWHLIVLRPHRGVRYRRPTPTAPAPDPSWRQTN
ncbi:hypothetical protein PSPO01_01126 [Paraphaeosphaeria sporulosa]